MTRVAVLVIFGGIGVLAHPTAAPAQYGMPFGYPAGMSGGYGRTPLIVPSLNPFFYVPRYNYQYGTQLSVGGFSLNTYQSYSGVTNPYAAAWALNQLAYVPPYSQGGSYISGGLLTRSDLVLAAQRNLMRAQRDAGQPPARSEIAGQWGYEKGAPPSGSGGGGPFPDPLQAAVVAPEPDKIVSGDALNDILREVMRVEAKGAKGPSAFIPPLLLEDIRFAGAPAADLLNLVRLGDHLRFPPGLDAVPLTEPRLALDRDFAAVAAVVQTGKSPEAAKVAKLGDSFQKFQDPAAVAIKELPFEEAAAARRFLNRVANAIKALKGGAATGLIDPKWSGEGLTVADLVRHMTKHKLLFGPAPRGRDEAYATMHRNLVTYLFVLNQSKK